MGAKNGPIGWNGLRRHLIKMLHDWTSKPVYSILEDWASADQPTGPKHRTSPVDNYVLICDTERTISILTVIKKIINIERSTQDSPLCAYAASFSTFKIFEETIVFYLKYWKYNSIL